METNERILNLVKNLVKKSQIESAVMIAYLEALQGAVLTLYADKYGKSFSDEMKKQIFDAAHLKASETLSKLGLYPQEEIEKGITDLLNGLNIYFDSSSFDTI